MDAINEKKRYTMDDLKRIDCNWKVSAHTPTTVVEDDRYGYFVASTNIGSLPHNTQLANARLIAAAPDLLKACIDWLNYFEDSHPIETGETIIERMRSAVKKALD